MCCCCSISPSLQALQELLLGLPPEVFAARCVRPVQRYLDGLVRAGKLGAARLQVLGGLGRPQFQCAAKLV